MPKFLKALPYIVAFGLIALLIFWIASALNGVGDKVPSSISSYHVIDDNTVMVEYRVENTTARTGKSSCSITMHDEAYSYSGSDSGYESAKEINPGETYAGVARVDISGSGAKYVSKGNIDCRI